MPLIYGTMYKVELFTYTYVQYDSYWIWIHLMYNTKEVNCYYSINKCIFYGIGGIRTHDLVFYDQTLFEMSYSICYITRMKLTVCLSCTPVFLFTLL